MRVKKGFSAVELLIAMIIAVVFLLAGYQVFQVILKTSKSVQLESGVSNLVQTYLSKAATTDPCTTSSASNSATVNGTNVSLQTNVTCQDIYSSGLKTTFYNNTSLTSPAADTMIDYTVDHSWGANSPTGNVNADGFSAKWEGYITIPTTGTYVISATSDDGEILYLNGTAVISQWAAQNLTTWTYSLGTLTAGQKIPVVYEMYEQAQVSVAKLQWSISGGSVVDIPASALSHKSTVSKVAVSANYTSNGESKTVSSSKLVSQQSCASGFIRVPGSSTYGTSDFCVMKYEAKNNGSNVAVSTASGTPWTSISQNTARGAAASACDGCHLITEAEWMTIAQNVLGVDSNWSDGAVGHGFIYNGHVNNNPANSLAASSNDADGNYGETSYDNSSVDNNNRRTLTLSNGEVIWDLSGNVYESLSDTLVGGQPGASTDTGYSAREWNAVSQHGFPTTSMPVSMASGVLASINSWTTANGIGAISSYYNETGTRVFMRGGWWTNGRVAGVLRIDLDNLPSDVDGTAVGFRAAYTLPVASN